MLHVFSSNRLEFLADRLVDRVGAAGGSPLREDVVVVPSAAMRRHLTLALARRHGICANVRFPYLAQWLWERVAAFDPSVGPRSPLETEPLAWRVWGELQDAGWVDAHPRLAAWIADADPVMRWELALRLASLFGEYAAYRPDWLERWGRGEAVGFRSAAEGLVADARWQAELWRRVAAGVGIAEEPNPLRRVALELARGGAAPAGALPAEVHVFCQPSIPPLYLDALVALAGRADVHLYVLNPCVHFWFDVVERRRLVDLVSQGKADHHEVRHRLLAAWGKQSQSQIGLVVERIEGAIEDGRFEPAGGETLLARLQDSILELDEPAPGALRPREGDRSIEVHACHSLARQLEVLQDRLLGLFREREDLAPSDVLVVVPDLEAAAPLVDAVFGSVPRERRIPFELTGRGRSRVNGPARALVELLALARSRVPVSGFAGLLQQPPVARRFGLDDESLRLVHEWLRDAGVHWALDAAHRESLGLPAENRHSVGDGLDRLLLGYALPSTADAPFGAMLPAGDPEGSDALALGALAAFAGALASLRRETSSPRRAAEWPRVLARALAAFVDADADPEDHREVERAIDRLADAIDATGADRPVPFDVVRAALERTLDDPARGGVPGGAVTFTSMASLRNVPYRVVCVLGLDDGVFPSSSRPAEFDLLAHDPRPGDRQRRADDRNVFLDLVLAARETLHLSYTGRSARDNSQMPPSVLVSELMDWLEPLAAESPHDPASLAAARARIVVEHPLQPFAEAAFLVDGDPRRRSHDAGYAEALRERSRAARGGDASAGLAGAACAPEGADVDGADDDAAVEPAPPLFASPLPAAGDEWSGVTLDQLQRFFNNPCRYLLERRLGVSLPRDEDELADDEPFLPSLPSRSALAQRLLPHLLAGASPARALELALAGREMPAGAIGRVALESELAGLHAFAADVRAHHDAPCVAPHTASIELAAAGRTWRLSASFSDLRAAGLVRFRYDEPRASDYLRAWLNHLVLCACPAEGVARRTVTITRGDPIEFAPCESAAAHLADLLELYAQGLREPVYFFPKTAWAWFDNGESRSAALGRWRSRKGSEFGEGDDAAYRLALRGLPDPMGDGWLRFEETARRVVAPLAACLEGERAR